MNLRKESREENDVGSSPDKDLFNLQSDLVMPYTASYGTGMISNHGHSGKKFGSYSIHDF